MTSSSSVFVNADVTTLDEAQPRARGFVVENGAIVRLLDARPTGLAKDVHVVDCAGAAIVPGFHDCHVHLTDTGLMAGDHDLGGCASVDAMLDRVRSLPDRVLYAGNYEEHRIAERRAPTMGELDAVSGDRLVLLTRR